MKMVRKPLVTTTFVECCMLTKHGLVKQTLGTLRSFDNTKSACARNHRNRDARATVHNRRHRLQINIVKIQSGRIFWPAGSETIVFLTCWEEATNRRADEDEKLRSGEVFVSSAFKICVERMSFLQRKNKRD